MYTGERQREPLPLSPHHPSALGGQRPSLGRPALFLPGLVGKRSRIRPCQPRRACRVFCSGQQGNRSGRANPALKTSTHTALVWGGGGGSAVALCVVQCKPDCGGRRSKRVVQSIHRVRALDFSLGS